MSKQEEVTPVGRYRKALVTMDAQATALCEEMRRTFAWNPDPGDPLLDQKVNAMEKCEEMIADIKNRLIKFREMQAGH